MSCVVAMTHEHALLSSLDMSSICAATEFIMNIIGLMPILYQGLLFDDSMKDAERVRHGYHAHQSSLGNGPGWGIL